MSLLLLLRPKVGEEEPAEGVTEWRWKRQPPKRRLALVPITPDPIWDDEDFIIVES